jgi:2-hydroxy-3-oxopropionate reductase
MFKEGRIGFIGLGIMGKPMAKNLMKAGYELVVYDIGKDVLVEMEQLGATVASSSKQVAEQCNGLVFTMLPNSPHVKEAIMGESGILQGAKEGLIIVDTSSIAPGASQECFKAAAKKGVKYLDAPVSGGEPKAIDGTLAIMVGGDEAVFEQVKDILLIVGASAVYCGECGSGNTTKLANQIIVALNIAAVSEAFVLAKKAGVDPEKVFDAIKGGLAGSTVMNAKVPLALEGNFKPGFRIELHIKDLQNALDTAHQVGVPIPLTAGVMEIMQALKVDGKAADDHGGIIQYYEKLAGVDIRK